MRKKLEMDAETFGRGVLERAGVRVGEVPRGGAVAVARKLHGRDVIRVIPRALFEATTGELFERPKIVIAKMSPERSHWAVARMLARIELRAANVTNVAENDVAAYFVAPRETVVSLSQGGSSLDEIADVHAVTQTCAALRIVECGEADGVVVTPLRIYRPRGAMSWVSDDEVRRFAKGSPRSVRKVRITDEPGRVALLR